MRTSRPRLFLSDGDRQSWRHRDPPTLNLVLAITAFVLLAAGCLILVAASAG